MIKKEDAIIVLEGLMNNDNESKVKIYLEKIRQMTDEQWQQFLNSKSIDSIEEIERIANELLARRADQEIKPLNDLISYGISGNTIHIHVVPDDLHSMLSSKGMQEGTRYLIDALEQIKQLIQSEEYGYIENVFAVSPIMRRPITDIFERLGFATKTKKMEEVPNDEDLKYFYEMFKGKGKKLGRAILTREQLLSEEWEQLKNSKKAKLGDDQQEQ